MPRSVTLPAHVGARTHLAAFDVARTVTTVLPILVIAALVLAIWAPGARYRGLNYETTLVYDSATKDLLGGFLWDGDPLRIFTSVFYHLGYISAELTGNSGDYIFYQYVYAALWLARGILIFFIVRALLPAVPLAAYLAGGLTIVHASDGATNWVGQLNQFGFMFWLALAALFLVWSVKGRTRQQRLMWIVLAAVSEFLCLWSYESPLPLIVVLPVLVLLAVQRAWRSSWWTLLVWYVVPIAYVSVTLAQYLDPATAPTYQQSIVSKEFTIAGALKDWIIHTTYSLEFWQWNAMTPESGARGTALIAGLAGSLVFLVSAVAYIRLVSRSEAILPPIRTALTMLVMGLVLLVLSFPVYVLISGNTNMWRTQMLSGFGAAIVIAAVVMIVGRLTSPYLAVGLASIVVFFGIGAGVRAGAYHSLGWEKHRAVMAQVVNLVPEVQRDALILIVDMPKDQDPFGDSMWFDFPVRMSYPSHIVSGGLLYAPPNSGENRWLFDSDDLQWNGAGYPPPVELRDVPYSELVLLGYGAGGELSVLSEVPAALSNGDSASGYDPMSVIIPGAPQADNRRRFAY